MALVNGAPATAGQLRALALTNYGHFTTLRVTEGGRVAGLALHLERLVRDCRTVFGAELDPERVRALGRAATDGHREPFLMRITVFDPDLDIGRPGDGGRPHLLITTRPAASGPMPPLRVRTIHYLRELPQVKHTGLFGPLHHRRRAQLDGFDDALFTDEAGVIAEGGTWNIGFYDGRRVLWPDAPMLPGVTMSLLRDAHRPSATLAVGVRELPRMQAAFATNAAFGVRPISTIDHTSLSPDHPVLADLSRTLRDHPTDPW